MEKNNKILNPVDDNTRLISIAIFEFFKESIVSYQGVYYQVDLIEPGKTLFVDKTIYELIKEKIILFDPEKENLLPDYPDRTQFDNDFEYTQAIIDEIDIKEIKKVSCKIKTPISMFVCSNKNCNFFGNINAGINKNRKCPECKSDMFQAPIFVLKDKIKSTAKNMPEITKIPNEKDKKVNKWKRLATLDPRYPFASLKLYTPGSDPKKGKSIVRKHYTLAMPSNRLIRPIVVSVTNTKGKSLSLNDRKKYFNNELLLSIDFYEKIEVYQIVIGYAFTQSGNSYSMRPMNGRKFITEGIVYKLSDNVYEIALEYVKKLYSKELFDEFFNDIKKLGDDFYMDDSERNLYNRNQLKRWVLHSFAHSFLMMLPFVTGLEYNKFYYSYNIKADSIIIYDNEEGGTGGTKLLAENEDIWDYYMNITKERIKNCDCRSRCMKCIVLNTCGEVNNALNRHLIAPILNIETYYE